MRPSEAAKYWQIAPDKASDANIVSITKALA